ncbi:MAG: aminotransferase class I/II-fold pyridoxal phosphate-dependent enzyme [Bacteroidota bacterium]
MGKFESVIKTLDEIGKIAKGRGLIHLYSEDEFLNGRFITIKGEKLVNFGSCSYLGLEMDERLKFGAIDAVNKYGTQFSSSRTYVSCANYKEFEELAEKIFNAPVLLSTCSSLAHQVVMPIVMESNDCVIFDQQAHFSMQDNIPKLKHNDTFTTIIRHSRLDELESRIIEYRSKYNKIWYIVDGVYSMYGDFAPTKEIIALLNKHKQLHLYVDDAHGMSWAGKNGAGHFLSETSLHSKMIMVTSLAKGFGSCGGVIVFPDEALRDKVKNWGGPNTHSGPQQPATVGASIASAKIHLSEEIYELQNSLREKIAFANHIFENYQLPLVSNSEGPIFFVGLGLTRMGYNMVRRIMDEGLYVNLGIFPAVPENCTGIRFTITNHLQFEDIEKLAQKIAYHLPKAIEEEGRTMNDIYKVFKKNARLEAKSKVIDENHSKNDFKINSELSIEKFTTIKEIDKEEWNKYTGKIGCCDYDNLLFYEDVFSKNSAKENNWEFFYYIIRDKENKPILSTFFTVCFVKDDMLSPANISENIEIKRQKDSYYLTSKTFMMGSSLSAGEHLYVDKQNVLWKLAMVVLLDSVWEEYERQEAVALLLRDFKAEDVEIREFFMDHGFIKIDIEGNNIVDNSDKLLSDNFFQLRLNSRKRRNFRNDIIKNHDLFSVSISHCKKEDVELYFQLYKNVKAKKLDLNTFDLPIKLFEKMCDSSNWEVIKIETIEDNKVVSVIFCEKNEYNYCPVIIGMDYTAADYLNVYKKSLYNVIKRGLELKKDKICLDLTASTAKYKLGADVIKQVAFIQMKDHYNQDFIDSMKLNS